jgi:hypothetical protein
MAYPASFPNIQYGTSADVGLVADLRMMFNEPVARDVSDTQIQYFLDRGASIAARKSKCSETGQTYITLATGTRDYAFPSAMFTAPAEYAIEVDGVYFCDIETATPVVNVTTGCGLTRISKRQLGHLPQNTAGAPKYWCVSREAHNTPKITVWPVPTSDQNSHLCEVFFFRVANTLKAADTSTTHYLPEYMREIPLWYALSECYRKIGRVKTAEQYRGYFDNLVDFFRQDRYGRIHDVDSRETMGLLDYTQE